MKYKAIQDERTGEIVWLNGKAPAAKPIGQVNFIGWERADFVRDYRARPEAHPSGEDNIKFCEHITQSSRDDIDRSQNKYKRRFF